MGPPAARIQHWRRAYAYVATGRERRHQDPGGNDHLRGLVKVSREFALVSLTHNLLKLWPSQAQSVAA